MKQQGNTAMGMVLLILLMGSLTLHASREMLAQSLLLVADEQHHIQDYWQAHSALQWGLAKSWPPVETLFCQQDAEGGWNSCLQRGENGESLLKGQGIGRELALWQWVEIHGNRISARPHGWLDYCPLPDAKQCP